ncbi:MAG TPA: 30S ribosomal protein S20 [Candidatus Saccharimonadales bacterium]|jgi:small subunit ribosomal protein S20
MPIIKSAKKRVRTAEKAAIRNSKTKRILKTALKAFRKDVADGAKTAESHADAQSNIDKAAKKGLIHKNKAARQKAQLARTARDAAKSAGTSEAPAKKTTAAKKAAVAKAAPKKAAPKADKAPAAKKPATSKAVEAKKAAVKKATPKK